MTKMTAQQRAELLGKLTPVQKCATIKLWEFQAKYPELLNKVDILYEPLILNVAQDIRNNVEVIVLVNDIELCKLKDGTK